jgi:hypothetical protein
MFLLLKKKDFFFLRIIFKKYSWQKFKKKINLIVYIKKKTKILHAHKTLKHNIK